MICALISCLTFVLGFMLGAIIFYWLNYREKKKVTLKSITQLHDHLDKILNESRQWQKMLERQGPQA